MYMYKMQRQYKPVYAVQEEKTFLFVQIMKIANKKTRLCHRRYFPAKLKVTFLVHASIILRSQVANGTQNTNDIGPRSMCVYIHIL
jgi:hypothetical protein